MTADTSPQPHDSEAGAASFLGGELTIGEHATFEAHLLGCDACWQEVELGRTGRRLAESARAVAPTELRERLRSVVADATPSADAPPSVVPRQRRHLTTPALTALATAAALVVGLVLVNLPASTPREQPVAIEQVVAGFRSQQLPGTQMPTGRAPDLRALDLRQVGAAAGTVAGTTMTAFAYQDSVGRGLVVYLSGDPFPTALGAQQLSGPDGPWVAVSQGVTVLCARSPHALLVLSTDRALVMAAAEALRVT